jgi:CMP-N-acetylneuraminic acid synthetase
MLKKIFIPIKTNSTRVPNKNFRYFGNKKLYDYVIYKYLENKDIDIYIDTDSEEIFNFYRSKNIKAYKRENSLIGDDISVNLLIENFINKYIVEDCIIAQIHVTNPFLKKETLLSGFDMINSKGYDSIVSSNIIQSRLWREESYGYSSVNHNPLKLEKTQDLCKIYEENSCFYIFKSSSFLKYKNRIGINPFFYGIDFPENLDIDNESDWDLCLKTMKMLEGN